MTKEDLPNGLLTQQRMKLIEVNLEEIVACHGRSLKNGISDCVVLVLDIHDSTARSVSKLVGGVDTDGAYAKAKEEGLVLTRCVALDRQSAIKLLVTDAPQLGSIAPGPMASGLICVVSLSADGAYVGVIKPQRTN